jgi:rod shape-determining protein MreD
MKDKINYYIFLPAMILLFFLETTFIATLFYDSFPPNLVLAFLFAAVFLSASADFLYPAFIFGFLYDTFSGANFGLFTASFVLAAMAAYRLRLRFMQEETFLKVVILSIGSALVYNILYLLLAVLVFNDSISSFGGYFLSNACSDAAYAAVLVYPAMQLISKRQK